MRKKGCVRKRGVSEMEGCEIQKPCKEGALEWEWEGRGKARERGKEHPG